MAILDKKDLQNFIGQFDNRKHKRNDSVQLDTLLLVAISSALGGALLGVLFAPDKGKNTRKKITQKSDEYLKEIKKNTEELSQQLKSSTDAILGKSSQLVDNVESDAKGYALYTFQELYDLAKELKIKGYSQMNKSELLEALSE